MQHTPRSEERGLLRVALHPSFSQKFPLTKSKHLWILKTLASAFFFFFQVTAGEKRVRKEEIPTSSISYYGMYCNYKMQIIKDHTDNEKVKSSVNRFVKQLFKSQ